MSLFFTDLHFLTIVSDRQVFRFCIPAVLWWLSSVFPGGLGNEKQTTSTSDTNKAKSKPCWVLGVFFANIYPFWIWCLHQTGTGACLPLSVFCCPKLFNLYPLLSCRSMMVSLTHFLVWFFLCASPSLSLPLSVSIYRCHWAHSNELTSWPVPLTRSAWT